MKKTIVLCLIFALPGRPGFSQSDRTKAAIDSIAGFYRQKYALSGLSVGVVSKGKTWLYSYGHTDQTRQHPVTDSTMFHQASVSKLFTGLAVMQLVEKGKLRLEDAVADLLPEFRMRDPEYKAVRIKHLLTHSSGLKWDNLLQHSPNDPSAIPLFLDRFKDQKLNFKPGERMSYATYSNAGFDLLGILVERVSGLRFDEYVRQNIFLPAGMNRSTFDYRKIPRPLLAWPQIVEGKSKTAGKLNAPWKIDTNAELEQILETHSIQLTDNPDYGEPYEHNPSGNLISSPAELTLWIKHLLEIYRSDLAGGIIGRKTLADMWEIQKKNPANNVSIGWGWWITLDKNLGKMVFHVGSNPGFCSIVALYPERDFGICISGNSRHAQRIVWHELKTDLEKQFAD